MKIGTLLTTAIVSLSTVGGGLAVYVAVTKYQTMDRIAEAQGRLAIVRAVSDIPRYLNPERGFATNILYGPATVDPAQLAEHDKLRKQTDGARDKMNALRKELPGSLRRRRRHRQPHRRHQFEIHRPARRHRQGDRGTGGCAQGRRQEDRRRQRRAQRRRHRAAQRAGPPHGDPQRRCLPPVQLRQHRHDAARHRRPQCQRAQEPRRRARSVGDRRREGRHRPHRRAAPTRS